MKIYYLRALKYNYINKFEKLSINAFRNTENSNNNKRNKNKIYTV